MSVFFDLFAPSRRHLDDERNRLEWTRDEEGEGDPHRGPIDLDSGVVSIKVRERKSTEPPDEPSDEPSASEPSDPPRVTRPAARRTRPGEP
jgi:hypothetical protein